MRDIKQKNMVCNVGKEEERGIKSRKETLETKSHNTASYRSIAEGAQSRKKKIL